MEIREFTLEVPVESYVVGEKKFKTEDEAKMYIKNVEEFNGKKFFNIVYAPDLTEGRGYYKEMIITTTSDLGINLIYTFLRKLLGPPVAWVQGVSPMANYTVREMLLKTYEDELAEKRKPYTGVGSYKEKKKLVIELGSPTTEKEIEMIVAVNKEKVKN